MKRKCYVVMGPYRSGTSLVARVLQQFGVSAGPEPDLYEATDWNPSGYIQRPDITSFNTRIIASAGGTLTDTGSPLDIYKNADANLFGELDRSWMNNFEKFLIKDPRFCCTFYTWYQHQILADYEPFIIRVSRNIEATAKSALVHYDVKHYCGNSMETALRVISSYNHFAAWHLENMPVPAFHIIYDDLVANPEKTILQLAKFMGVSDINMISAAVNTTSYGRSKIKTLIGSVRVEQD